MDFDNNLEHEIYADYPSAYHEFEKQEDDDDIFYDELRRQVLLLTEEDSDDEELHEIRGSPHVAKARKDGSIDVPTNVKPHGSFYNWLGNKEDYAAPAWVLNLWKSGNGTGVFIPQIVQSRRRNRPRRKKKNEKGRTHRRLDKMN